MIRNIVLLLDYAFSFLLTNDQSELPLLCLLQYVGYTDCTVFHHVHQLLQAQNSNRLHCGLKIN